MINPCPFCKSNFIALSLDDNKWSMVCVMCWAETKKFSTEVQAVNAWNEGRIHTKCKTMTL